MNKSKECPPDKILNPATNRCVSITGAIGKKLNSQNEPKDKNETKAEPKTKKECPPEKILNPATNRCVSATGATAKKLNSQNDPKEKTKPNTNAKKETKKNIEEEIEPKKRGRPKKVITEPIETKEKKKRGRPTQTGDDDMLKKELQTIPPSYYYDVDEKIKKIKDSGYSRENKLRKAQEILIDLNELNSIMYPKWDNKKAPKTKLKYKKFLDYNDERIIKIKKYLEEIVKEINDFKERNRKGAGIDKSQIIQSVLVDKSKYDLADSILYNLKHKNKVKKIDETNDYYRFRQVEPNLLKKKGYKNYKTIEKDDGIKEVIAY